MDVTPPTTLRRLGIALAGVAVAALTGAACALSFDDLRALAIRGEARADLAYLYPAAFDALLVVALISLLLLRSARLLVRVQTATVLVLLIVAAAAVDVTTALRLDVATRPATVGVAVAPWVMLALALWLWLLLIKHVQDRRGSVKHDDDRTAEHDLVPFHRGGGAEAPPPLVPTAQPVLEPTPVVGPTAAPETPPISERVTSWPTSEPARIGDASEPAVRSPEAAYAPESPPEIETREARELAVPLGGGTAAAKAGPEHSAMTEHGDAPEHLPPPPAAEAGHPHPEAPARAARDAPTEAHPRATEHPPTETNAAGTEHPPTKAGADVTEDPSSTAPADAARDEHDKDRPAEDRPVEAEEPRERRPVRWGDRVKPTDVLVHPRTPADRDVDTQPVRVLTEPAGETGDADPEHGPEAADTTEGGLRGSDMEDTAPHPVIHDTDGPDRSTADAPAGRLRSTPLPPEE
ncbi:DUF2637 domain-containing protein [Nonomuraea cavernae]|uniref:DUF2637 domain-containing protein n=1 Tax=Nonomuraea cavernae TaxID=2045107 RepID=A0A917YVN2_9ACTN|nr:DUF2637 domain-containing protein [Nonomuraea cavernae]MCA2187310.1 DUF2637 domain-containing protein [Nonomuraea cavernae]GGO68223.1 hypothetical protein GCM10012289_26490 [Nonomuraea cavernae]